MESYEILKQTVNNLGAKSIASDMNLSTSLIYKWCQSKDSPDAAGTDNPLDRIEKILDLTGDDTPVRWLCEKAGGFFIKNPSNEENTVNNMEYPLKAAQEILSEFSELLEVVSKSIEDDQMIDKNEAKNIRGVWETLKSITESFVVACESGKYCKND